jgi:hypothetical protein
MSTHDAFLRAHVAARHEALRNTAHPFTSVDRPSRRKPTWPTVRVPTPALRRRDAPRPVAYRSPRFRRA